jgi:hypothetical protein
MKNYPTNEEIEAALREAMQEGPMTKNIERLAELARKNQWLNACLTGMTEVAARNLNIPPGSDELYGLVTGAMMSGLDIGLRIGEARIRRLSRVN